MGRIAVLAVAVIFAGGLLLSAADIALAKEYKIAYVDLAKVFDEYKKTKESEKKLEEKGKSKEAERTKMVDELRKLKDEQALLSEKAKADKQVIIDNKIKALQDFDRVTRDELVKERNDMLGNILKDIEKVVTEYAKTNGYDMVLNSRMLLYGGEQYDLTNEILSRLNK
ncbi:MAG: OmpH family outer membrane protein [Candidatus Omnitrophica bacterium]|nr:OmpH family outer membrane protein [Candidatus Omnitrophota bacterium]MCM8791178.1 OmpH family outer membrane protein [Candidatus Omnitrophota bacterium]